MNEKTGEPGDAGLLSDLSLHLLDRHDLASGQNKAIAILNGRICAFWIQYLDLEPYHLVLVGVGIFVKANRPWEGESEISPLLQSSQIGDLLRIGALLQHLRESQVFNFVSLPIQSLALLLEPDVNDTENSRSVSRLT